MKNNLNNWPSFSKEEANAVSKVLLSSKVNYWTGQECRNFEKEFSSWAGVKYSIAVSNGTVALDLALRALGISEGDEVIVTPRSFIASVSSVISVGAKPVFADVDINTGNLSEETIRMKITKRTKAIICVHLGGLPCDMDPIMKLATKSDIYVIEDCAQAHGATYKGKSVGSIGHIGAWSFCQDKIMSTGGEGGMVTTNNKKLWNYMWSYKDHGKSYDTVYNKQHAEGFRWLHESFGTNFRMTEMQGIIGRIQLKKMNKWTRLRKRNSDILINCLKDFGNMFTFPHCPDNVHHANYKTYCFVDKKNLNKNWSRDRIVNEINKLGVPCFSGSCSEIYKEKAFLGSSFAPKKESTNSRLLGERTIMFLCHPTLTLDDMKFMTENIRKVLVKASI